MFSLPTPPATPATAPGRRTAAARPTGRARLAAAALLTFALALAPAGCDRGGGASDQVDVAAQEAATPVEAVFRYGPVELGSSRAALQERLGEPDSVRSRVVPNPHDQSVMDTVFTVLYPGLTAEVYRATYDGRELLASLAITDDRHLRPESPLRLGMTREEIRLALGEADRTENGDLFFVCHSCTVGGQDSLELRLDGGRLAALLLHYWID